jgi:hypothetical protein
MKKKQYHGVDGKLYNTPTGDDGQVLTSSVAEDIRQRTNKGKRRRG